MPEQVAIHPETLPTPDTPAVETIGTSEAAPRPEQPEKAAPVEVTIPAPAPAPVTPAPSAQAQRLADIERVLEEDLSELYFKLPEDKRAEFRQQGEEAARQIETLLSAATVQVRKIVDIIKNWLKLIPGINTFFLEQEAKIKADHLMKMRGR